MNIRPISLVFLWLSLLISGCAPQVTPGLTATIHSPTPALPEPTPTFVKTMPPAPEPPLPTSSPSPKPAPGEIQQAKFASATLGRNYHYYIFLPAGYETSGKRYPVFYLLHGRGDNMSAWATITRDLDRLFASGDLPPFLAVMPDFPSSSKASYYIDSAYTGVDYPAEAVETAFFTELIPEIDKAYRTIPDRQSRAVAGYSMGGYGALRYLLAHPDKFMGAVVMSPAVYTPLPPAGSSTREFGAFGKGSQLFDAAVYQSKNYPALWAGFTAAKLKSYLFIASGDDEYANPLPAEMLNDIDMEAHLLYTRARRVDYLATELRILEGGHSWDVWRPAFIEGARYLSQFLVSQK